MSRNFLLTLWVISLAMAAGWGWIASEHYHEPAHVASVPKPPHRQADGSLAAGVTGKAPAPQQMAPSPGAKALASFTSTGKPSAPVARAGTTAAQVAQCDELTICPAQTTKGTFWQGRDGQYNLTLDGQQQTAELSAAPASVAKTHPWAAGAVYDGHRWGPVVTYQFQALPIEAGVYGKTGEAGVIVMGRF